MIKSILAAAALAAVSTVAVAQTPPTPGSDHSGHAAVPAAAAKPTINSSIKDLLAYPATAAILEKHLPGVSQHPALPQFQDMTLADVAPLSGGAISATVITAIDADIKALPAG
ncbi:MAG: hypothetical protein Q8S03_04305 [Brevundimonas sp.]|uniref:hypothetical protein n=1 Tax=Brevundimonas sp. TaxID=1871086 RepID=UPI002732DE4D|nr:hypothetical protein [Brevundimonas sp.]MDP3403890.1 hypothetical protein [Brevundimonas sp.]